MAIALTWSQVAKLPANDALNLLEGTAKPFGSTTISDYAFMPDQACTGLYFFFDGSDLAYIGKSTSRAFIERVPSHLDCRPGSWFGTLLQKMVRRGENPDKSCVERALGYRVVLLAIGKDDDVQVNTLESTLRQLWCPQLNKSKRRIHDHTVSMRDLAQRR